MAEKTVVRTKIKIKRGDKVIVLAGKDKGKQGKVLMVDRKKNRVVVEGVNMVTKHKKARTQTEQSGIIKMESPLNASNVAYLHNGKATKLGYKVETKEVDGKTVTVKSRVAKSTGEIID